MKNKVLTTVVFILAAILLLGCGSEQSTEEVSSSSSDFVVGDTVIYGDYDVVLKSARVSNNGALEGKTYIYLMFDVKNNTFCYLHLWL